MHVNEMRSYTGFSYSNRPWIFALSRTSPTREGKVELVVAHFPGTAQEVHDIHRGTAQEVHDIHRLLESEQLFSKERFFLKLYPQQLLSDTTLLTMNFFL